MQIIRVAVIQDSPVVFDQEATINKTISLIKKAAGQGARLVLFPENFIPAYPVGLDFGARFGFLRPEGRDDFRRYYEGAVEEFSPACAD